MWIQNSQFWKGRVTCKAPPPPHHPSLPLEASGPSVKPGRRQKVGLPPKPRSLLLANGVSHLESGPPVTGKLVPPLEYIPFCPASLVKHVNDFKKQFGP